MKYLSLILIIILFSSLLLISCRETSRQDAKQDVVEDIDDLMQSAEDDIKEVVNKDSSHIKENKEWINDTIQKNN
ncbi:hypothetical protein EI546_15205 [Aequorivita sp. H23M31]|uniref:Uncharacterized protein n=1 Tax=Aequorivita ciconiae TaxID=2494375 RepID=A0A410G6W9_9FLAO|nr:hypothetical protein [Aequorivita sp. H23M31]QAA82980.1 hypothetical protein EI546_15205 [Aequorivita sp. H23M31]